MFEYDLTHFLGSPYDKVVKIPLLGYILKTLNGGEGDYGEFFSILCLVMLFYGLSYTPISQAQVVSIVFALAPIWVTYQLIEIFHWKWSDYVGKKFFLYNGRTTLRIKLPQNVLKTPEAMEFVLAQIHNTQNPDNLMQTYLQGKRPLNCSLEIVSIGGDVRLYVNVPTSKSKPAFEANMYSQYPGVEVTEEPVDYIGEIGVDEEGKEWEWMSFHMGKRADQEFPIKTYIDYEMHKPSKEEGERIDPMTPMLEILGSIGPNERLYVQLVCTPFRKSSFKLGALMLGETKSWEKAALAKVDEILQRDPKTKAPKSPEGTDFDGSPRISPGERTTVEAIERNADKYAYEVGIRWIYAAKPGHFKGDRINPTIRSFSQYDLTNRNTIGVRWRTDFNYMKISDPFGKKIPALKRQEMKEYKLRKYFNKNSIGAPKIMTVEELATMFHVPGSVAFTPNLGRIPSTRSEAPNNLPIGELPT